MKKYHILFFYFISFGVFGQIDSTKTKLYQHSVEEILAMPIQQETTILSASKRHEKLFESPLSASVISREQIEKSGCLSIPEALRLATGMIVRETNSGNYDIHIQGLDNVKPFKSQFALVESTSILVMIDGRPVYNYFQGGTFWESLPIDISDLEAIEVVRGASSALYGANAVTGVINLITSPRTKQTLKARATIQRGSHQSQIMHAYLSSRIGARWAGGFSFNQQYRQRPFKKYYFSRQNQYVPVDSLLFQGTALTNNYRYPHPEESLNRYGSNVWLDFAPTNELQMHLKGGWQNSRVQKMYIDNRITPLTTNTSRTNYLDFRANYRGLSSQISYNQGEQNVQGVTNWRYEFQTLFATMEYEIKKENYHIRTGFNYQSATYNDKIAKITPQSKPFLGGIPRNLNALSGFIRSEYHWKKLRFMGAIRAEKYNIPNRSYFPYQVAIMYQPHQNTFLRLVNGRANQGAFMISNFFYQENLGSQTYLSGNQNLDLAKLDLNEFGIRQKLNQFIELDGTMFRQKIWDLSGFRNIQVGEQNEVDNYEMQAQQIGTNLKVTFKNKKLNSYFSGSYQKTTLSDFPITADYAQLTDTLHHATPAFYGTFFMAWQLSQNLNLTATIYHFGKQEISTIIEGNISASGITNLNTDAFTVINFSVNYALKNNFSCFLNARNFNLGSKRQTFQVDDIQPEILIGLRYGL